MVGASPLVQLTLRVELGVPVVVSVEDTLPVCEGLPEAVPLADCEVEGVLEGDAPALSLPVATLTA